MMDLMVSMSMSMSMTMSTFIFTHFSGNLVSNWVALLSWHLVADWSWDFSLMLLGNLVALSLNVLLALGSIAVSLGGLSRSLVVTSITSMADDLGVVTNNSGAVMNLLVGFSALCGECLLTLFNVGCVNNSLAHWSWNLSLVLLWNLLAHLLNMLLALRP